MAMVGRIRLRAYGESGEPDEILEAYGLTSHAIVASALKVVDRKRNGAV
jgi:transketolase